MILRDPVHGLVAFEGIHERVVVRLLATREMQRLRHVRQLGFTSLVFPGAEHSRFTHSLGATHVMVRLLQRLRTVQAVLPAEQRIDEEAEADAVAAALLHDLGHGPFSHLWEDVLHRGRRHEVWTYDILLDDSTEVHRALESLSTGMAARVVQLLQGNYRLPYLARSISGTLDVDRCDYLLRDSHMTGVSYGVYDLAWLLQALSFEQAPDGQWVIAIEGRKGLPPIEGFFLARQFMYQQVYHHKATRAAEALIRAVLRRLTDLIRDGATPRGTPPAIVAAVMGQGNSVQDYLALDDIQLLASFQAWQQAKDPLLAELTRRLYARVLPKTLPLPDTLAQQDYDDALRLAREIVARGTPHPELFVRLDAPSDVPYSEPSNGAADGLWVAIRHQPLQRLGDASFLLGELRNKRITRPRLIFPAEFRTEIERAVAAWGPAPGTDERAPGP
ncbi:MAG: HD domain-containing protein [Myxococcales bacterium]|nr:HD domain-containing protein [Myxococcales bacterium]